LAAKTTFGSWHAGTRGIHTGFNILSVKSVFGRILPKLKDGTISAKNKSWQSHCFWHVQIVTHFVEGRHCSTQPITHRP
jgi:hypothetical protein